MTTAKQARELARHAESSAINSTMANALRSMADAQDELVSALKELDRRLKQCAELPASAAEAYDSFYRGMVSDLLTKYDEDAAVRAAIDAGGV